MRINTCIFFAFVALTAPAVPVWASSGAHDAEAAAEHGTAGPAPVLRLTRFGKDGFIDARRRLQDDLTSARDEAGEGASRHPMSVPEQSNAEIKALLDLAEFYLAYVMAPEGLSVLSGLDNTLPPAYAAQRDGLTLALSLLDTRNVEMPERAAAMLGEDHGDWKDQPLFEVLYYHRRDDYEAAARHIDRAASLIDTLSPELRRTVLPDLLDVAVEARDWPVARDLASRFSEFPALEKSPSYNYLLGRVAETGDDLVAAFDYYREASTGWDLWAHRSRVAIIELGLSTGTLPQQEARVLMDQARRAWTGDVHAIRLLQLMVGLDLEMGDKVAALEALATIMSRYPDSDAAPLARQQSRSLWTTFYDDGAAGRMSLSAFLDGHQKISPDYRFEPGFCDQTERLADYFLDKGATVVAADEFRETRDYLLVGRDLGLTEVEDHRLDLLQLKQAEALYQGGQLDEVAYVLAEGLLTTDAELNDRLNLLKAKLYTDQDEPKNVVGTELASPTLHYLRLRASAYFGEGDWDSAKTAYAEILDRSAEHVRFGDAIRLLLAAHRSGDKQTADALVRRFPDLTESPQWLYIARGFTEEAPALLPLREASANQRVERADETLRTLDSLDTIESDKN